MDADDRALLAAIIAHPDEDTPRLMYADWLQEHDQPERAEYIRLSIQLANLRYGEPDFETREAQLRERLRPFEKLANETWPREFAAKLPANRDTVFTFSRGFVDRVWCSVKYFLENADRVFQEAPLRALVPRTLTATTAKRLVNSPHLRRLREVKLLNPYTAHVLLRCPVVEIGTIDFSQIALFNTGYWDGVATETAAHTGTHWVECSQAHQLRELRHRQLGRRVSCRCSPPQPRSTESVEQ